MNSKYMNTINDLRKNAFLAGYSAGAAHFASAFSSIEILYSLYCNGVLKHNPNNPECAERDRFILSKGHGSLALYAVLCECGYFSKADLMNFSKPNSFLGGEPSLCIPAGIEASTGSLGHGLSIGVGMALSSQVDKSTAKTYVLLGDGECEEGSIWEAVMSATKYCLDNLVVILDYNRIQKMAFVEEMMAITDWSERFTAFGWECIEVDGHDIDALTKTFLNIKNNSKPHVIIANTIKGKGVSIMENNPAWHWRIPNRRELKIFMNELNITQEELELCK